MASIAVNGTTLYYELRGSGPPVLFISGATGDAGHWTDVAHARWVVGDETFEAFDPELRDRMLGNGEVLFGLEFDGIMSHLPTLEQLAEVKMPCVVAAGIDNRDPAATHHWFHEASQWLADGLHAPLVETPGAHVPQATHPRAFAETLRPILGKLAASQRFEA